jgi:phage baseplate assembly protein W
MASQTTTPEVTARKFKGSSVINQRIDDVKTDSPIVYGITTPLAPPKLNGTLFNQTTDISIQVIDNFKNMLYTNHGERLAKFDFGANLKSLLSERTAREDWIQEATRLISLTTGKYMPYISINSVDVLSSPALNDGTSQITLVVTFSIAKLGIDRRRLEIQMTNLG